jgi:hypothetical protein
MKKGFVSILKGTFLVSDDAPRNWLFLVFISALATLMIASSHAADRKVHEIAELNKEVQELRSEFVHTRSKVQRLKLESVIRDRVKVSGLVPATIPPQKIIVHSNR